MSLLLCVTRNSSIGKLRKLCSKHITTLPNGLVQERNIDKHFLKDSKHFFSDLTGPGTAWNIERLIPIQRVNHFMTKFPNIVKDLTEFEEHADMPEINKHYADLLRYVVPHGKRLRSYIAIAAYEMLEMNLTSENIRLANMMGWILEMFQGFLVLVDDIMDQSTVRRGAPAWHTKTDVGLNAVNDAFLVEQGIYSLLKKHFSNHHCYLPSVELFHDISRKTSKGQALDAMNTKNGRPDLQAFTMERFQYIAEYKTGYCTFLLPISLAMYMANLYDPEMHKQAKGIFKKMSHFYQIQDDVLDVWGNQKDSGKDKNDIKEGKCTWLAVVALQKASPSQRKVMENYFGLTDPEAVKKIVCLYEEMNLKKLYETAVEDALYKSIREDIQKFSSNERLQKLLMKVIEALFDRKC